MTKKDIDLLTRFIGHVDFLLGIIKLMSKSTHEAETLSKVQKTLPSMLKEFINFKILKIRLKGQKMIGTKKGEK